VFLTIEEPRRGCSACDWKFRPPSAEDVRAGLKIKLLLAATAYARSIGHRQISRARRHDRYDPKEVYLTVRALERAAIALAAADTWAAELARAPRSAGGEK
jgi:hypothetical protein